MKPKFALERLNHDDMDSQLIDITKMVFESGKVKSPAEPRNFVMWWMNGDIIKVFTARENDKLIALKVYLVMPDPFDATVKHKTLCFEDGDVEGFKEFIDINLKAF